MCINFQTHKAGVKANYSTAKWAGESEPSMSQRAHRQKNEREIIPNVLKLSSGSLKAVNAAVLMLNLQTH